MAGNTNISQKNNVWSDPDQLLHGISDMFINSELCINYANMKKKVKASIQILKGLSARFVSHYLVNPY